MLAPDGRNATRFGSVFVGLYEYGVLHSAEKPLEIARTAPNF